MPATCLTAMTSWRKYLRKKRTFKPRWQCTLPCLKQQLRSPAYWTVRLRVAGGSGTLSAQQLKMDVIRADERKIFATTKAFSNMYSCCHSPDDIMHATDLVFGGKRAFCERFLRWSRRFLWLRHRHPSFVMSCSFTNRGRLLAGGPWSSACKWPCGRLWMALGFQNGSSTDDLWSSTDGPWSSTDGLGFLRMALGSLRMAEGRPRMACGPLRMAHNSQHGTCPSTVRWTVT